MNEKWFLLSISEIEKKLKTNAASGLTRKAARSAWHRENRRAPGSHTLFLRRSKSRQKMLGEIFADFSLIMLLLVSFFALLFEDREGGFTVLLLCCVNTVLSYVFYYRSQRTMEQMNLYFVPTANVIRGGKLYRVSFENIVPGDVIILQYGDIVPADARLITSDNLSVAMRVGKNKYIPLKKKAQGVIAQDEKNPAKHENILHAGSVIESGSARAVVYATGMYTYLGIMTGGIPEIYSDKTPVELIKMKSMCSKLSIIAMLCILPFSVLSLILSYVGGGTATLSSSFITALSVSASFMTQLSCTLCKIFFVKKIRDISKDKNPSVIRTTEAFDKLGNIDYLFMLDGSAVTDGVLHFDTAFTSEGEIKSFKNPTSVMSHLFDFAAMYTAADANSLTLSVNLPDRFKTGLGEFLDNGNADIEALKIRYPVRSYIPGSPTHPTDRVYYTDRNKNMVLDVSCSAEIFSKCMYTMAAGQVQPLSGVGVDRLRHMYNAHISKGKTVLVFTVSSLENIGMDSDTVFIGAIVLREGVDKNAARAISALNKNGVKIISFAGCDFPGYVPQIPTELHGASVAHRDDFIRGQVPITYKFGEIDTYYGLNKSEILTILNFAKDDNKTVGIISFSDFASSVIEAGDVFISCSPIVNVISAKNEQELYTLELTGAASSSSCTQTVKSESDVLIPRPNGVRGGMASVASAVFAAKIAGKNLCRFFKYLLFAQFMRIILAGFPMIFGKPILDARHVLLCSFVIDFVMLFITVLDKTTVSKSSENINTIPSAKSFIRSNSGALLTILGVSIFAIVLPLLMDAVGIFGRYLYSIEYLFCAMLWMHMVLCYYIRYQSVLNIQKIIKNKLFMALLIGCVVFVVAIIFIPSIAKLFEMIAHPIPYFIVSFLPAIVFAVAMEFHTKQKS